MSIKSKLISIKNRVLNVLFWSVVSAAFIGPGTVTTATKAGATFGFDLLWALAFSTIACLTLQEAAARITISTGMNLGQAIAKQFEEKSTRALVLILIIGAIVLGCAAYQTGNILGAVQGLVLIWNISPKILVLAMGIFAAIALSLRSLQMIAKFMGMLVMLMGIAFFVTAIYLGPSYDELLTGMVVPKMPEASGAGLLILSLIGTTVVPYDLFLGSGVLDKKQRIAEMRFGLSVAIILGGIISMAVLSVGTAIKQEFSYQALAETLSTNLGHWSVYIFGIGMFIAGFSSAITAPLASAITAKSLFESENPKKWKTQSRYYKYVWGGVLLTGLIFGFAEVKPIPAIIIAQALNGLILPLVSIFLIFVVNDKKLMGDSVNRWRSNIILGLIVWVTLLLGTIKLTEALSAIWQLALEAGITSFFAISLITLGVSAWIIFRIYRKRQLDDEELANQKK